MNNFEKLRNYIKRWQKDNDLNFKAIPIDNHSYLIFNHYNETVSFIFSNKYLRDECRLSIPIELLKDYTYINENDNQITFYNIQ